VIRNSTIGVTVVLIPVVTAEQT